MRPNEFEKSPKAAWVIDVVLIEIRIEERRAIRLTVAIYGNVGNVPSRLRLFDGVRNFVVVATIVDTECVLIHGNSRFSIDMALQLHNADAQRKANGRP